MFWKDDSQTDANFAAVRSHVQVEFQIVDGLSNGKFVIEHNLSRPARYLKHKLLDTAPFVGELRVRQPSLLHRVQRIVGLTQLPGILIAFKILNVLIRMRREYGGQHDQQCRRANQPANWLTRERERRFLRVQSVHGFCATGTTGLPPVGNCLLCETKRCCRVTTRLNTRHDRCTLIFCRKSRVLLGVANRAKMRSALIVAIGTSGPAVFQKS